ncbi:Cytochrome P450 3A4 [Dermatophagoides pteronyssinus]|uniref:Cytochrome P450 3A4 n=1 Tax=Dermatophagoides pteronyssinus TaxID=6956 RepID=A0ABQ8J5I2_DERPT|nr:Cytochrome P450 3A4 [Dermatophagoides pteronyssinus]
MDIINDLINSIGRTGFFIILISVLYWYIRTTYSYWSSRGINGPPIVPFLGNFFLPHKPIALLHQNYIRRYGKFFGMYQGRKPILCIADPVIIKRILVQDFPMFRNRIKQTVRHKIFAQNLVNARDEAWKRIRSILSPMFTSSKMKKMESMIDQCADSMIHVLDNFAKKQESFLVHNVMGNFTMDVIAKCAFATDTNAHNDKENIFIFFMDMSSHVIQQRRKNESKQHEDMLELMIRAEHGKDKSFEKDDKFDSHHVNQDEEEIQQEKKIFQEIIGSKFLNEEEIIAQSMIFLLAGYETTASTLTFCIYELAKHPEVQNKLYDEIKTIGDSLDLNNLMKLPYLDAVISETLRKHPPALALGREAMEEYHIPEYNFTIEKNQALIIPVYAIHHDPQYYPDPETFNPDRFLPENRQNIIPYTYLPFGGGPRNCIGMRFALSEAKLGLANILKNFIIVSTDKTCDKLNVEKSFFLMKTTPIYVGVKKRT